MDVVRESVVASIQFRTEVYDRHKGVVRETVIYGSKPRPTNTSSERKNQNLRHAVTEGWSTSTHRRAT